MVRECCSANYLSGQTDNRNGDLNGGAEIINRNAARHIATNALPHHMRKPCNPVCPRPFPRIPPYLRRTNALPGPLHPRILA